MRRLDLRAGATAARSTRRRSWDGRRRSRRGCGVEIDERNRHTELDNANHRIWTRGIGWDQNKSDQITRSRSVEQRPRASRAAEKIRKIARGQVFGEVL